MVLAGPGSGKTTVITHRVKNLIKQRISSDKILVVTFTKAAAMHMQKRFFQIMEKEERGQESYSVTFGTFHSIFYQILKSHYSYKNDNIVSDGIKYHILKEIIVRKKIEVHDLAGFVQTVSGEISVVKSNLEELADYFPKCCHQDDFIVIYQEYEKELKAQGRIDFDDILLLCYELLKENQAARNKYQEMYQYILIDEFQDINRVQYEIIKLLAWPQNNLFIVGDDDQSIYGFRGARPDIMFQFREDFPMHKQIFLSVNYRCPQEIVRLSERLIAHNTKRFAKKITAWKQTGAVPDIRQFQTGFDEMLYVCNKIKEYQKQGIPPNEVAVLVRNNSQLFEVGNFLKNHNLTIFMPKERKNIYIGEVAKDVIAYVRAALTYDTMPVADNENLIRIINKPGRLISHQVMGQESMDFKTLKQTYAHSREILEQIHLLQFHFDMIRRMTPEAAIIYIRNATGYEGYLKQYAKRLKIPLSTLWKQIQKLQTEAGQFDTLQQWLCFVDDTIMGDEKNNHKTDSSQIQLMTMHSAKGLEFRVVFIVDANQGIIPSSKSIREKDYEEERRVFYVAMTRTSEFLHIYGVAQRLGCEAKMSLFVNECMKKDD